MKVTIKVQARGYGEGKPDVTFKTSIEAGSPYGQNPMIGAINAAADLAVKLTKEVK